VFVGGAGSRKLLYSDAAGPVHAAMKLEDLVVESVGVPIDHEGELGHSRWFRGEILPMG
jgi:hypothetical protein